MATHARAAAHYLGKLSLLHFWRLLCRAFSPRFKPGVYEYPEFDAAFQVRRLNEMYAAVGSRCLIHCIAAAAMTLLWSFCAAALVLLHHACQHAALRLHPGGVTNCTLVERMGRWIKRPSVHNENTPAA